MQTEAQVPTRFGQDYLIKLCRHFAHKVPVTRVGNQGLIEFTFGRCRIDVNHERMLLHIQLKADDQFDLAERVLTEHLLNITRQERPPVRWTRQQS